MPNYSRGRCTDVTWMLKPEYCAANITDVKILRLKTNSRTTQRRVTCFKRYIENVHRMSTHVYFSRRTSPSKRVFEKEKSYPITGLEGHLKV